MTNDYLSSPSAGIKSTAQSATPRLADLIDRPWWTFWIGHLQADGSIRKVPYGRDGQPAKADDPSTWITAAEAAAYMQPFSGVQKGLGLEFGEDLGDGTAIGGIDLDSCLVAGNVNPTRIWAEEALLRLMTYSEVSPSGSGIKAFFRYRIADLPALQKALGCQSERYGRKFSEKSEGKHPPAAEVYLRHRYFTVTDLRYPGAPDGIRLIPTDDLAWLFNYLRKTFKANDVAQEGQAPVVTGDAIPLDTLWEKIKDCGTRRADLARLLAGDFSILGDDQSRSNKAHRLVRELRRDGFSLDEVVQALKTWPHTQAWAAEQGTDMRQFERAWGHNRPGGGEEFDADPEPPKGEVAGVYRETICIQIGRPDLSANQAEAALIAAGMAVYQRGRYLMRPGVQRATDTAGNDTLAPALVRIEGPGLIDHLAQCAQFQVFDGRSENWRNVDPPPVVCNVLLSRFGKWTLPPVRAVTTTPTLRPDGSILTEAGYDRATALFHIVDPGLKIPAIPENPTRDDAMQALTLLEGLLVEFPFIGPVDRAVALSALITPVVRGALPAVPMHGIRAASAGTGKSFLVDVVSMILTGQRCPVSKVGESFEEFEKGLAGSLLAGYPIINIDNVTEGVALKGELLCHATERPRFEVRALGKSDKHLIDNTACIYATGNHLTFHADTTRRAIVATMDAKVENPETRQFRHDPIAMVAANRGIYVAACLTIVRAYIAAGLPGVLPRLASYEAWSDRVRSALVWLGCDDPVESMKAIREEDPKRIAIRTFIDAVEPVFAIDTEFTVKELVEKSWERQQVDDRSTSVIGFAHPGLIAALKLIAPNGKSGGIDASKLGNWIKFNSDYVVDAKKITKGTGEARGGVAKWRVALNK